MYRAILFWQKDLFLLLYKLYYLFKHCLIRQKYVWISKKTPDIYNAKRKMNIVKQNA